MTQKNNNLENYFRAQQVSLQWLPFLQALSREMTASADAADLRRLFVRVGERIADDVESRFRGTETLDQLEENLNLLWSDLNWGWAELQEVKGYIEIRHQAAPLGAAFGDGALDWSVGLLEGFYQKIFKVLGAGERMIVRAELERSEALSLCLRFGHQ